MTVLSNIESEQSESTAVSVSPGAMLRKERLAQELDQSRAAAQLHLSDAMIQALESDDFDRLPGPVFTQGYLRNYARLLGLPENEVLDAYQRVRPQTDTVTVSTKGTHAVKQEVRSSNRLVRLVTWLIVLGLLGLVIVWWQDHLHWQAEPVVDEQTEPETNSVTAAGKEDELAPEPIPPAFTDNFGTGPSQAQEVLQSESEPEPEADLESLPDEATLEHSPPEPVAVFPPPAPVSPVELPAEAALVQPATVDRETSLTEPQVAEETLQPTPPVPEQPSVADGLMVFEFTGACWAEVRDSTGKAHIIGEMGAGDRRSIPSDLGPYKIVLGNIKFARLIIDGKPFDLASQTRGVVARFTLDPTQL